MIFELKYLVEKTTHVDLPDIKTAESLVAKLLARERSVLGVSATKVLSIVSLKPPAQPQEGQVA